MLTKENPALTSRLRAEAALRPGESAKIRKRSGGRRFPGRIIADNRAEAHRTAISWDARNTIWMDGPRIDNGGVGAGYA